MHFNQTLNNTGYCTSNLTGYNNTPTCATPNCFNLGYNTTGLGGQQTGISNCCGPNMNTVNSQYQQNYVSGCCGPTT